MMDRTTLVANVLGLLVIFVATLMKAKGWLPSLAEALLIVSATWLGVFWGVEVNDHYKRENERKYARNVLNHVRLSVISMHKDAVVLFDKTGSMSPEMKEKEFNNNICLLDIGPEIGAAIEDPALRANAPYAIMILAKDARLHRQFVQQANQTGVSIGTRYDQVAGVIIILRDMNVFAEAAMAYLDRRASEDSLRALNDALVAKRSSGYPTLFQFGRNAALAYKTDM